ncbi:hypothetical protein EOD42_18975 [Rhodovarius crocodyli]|uniref:Uncharacterized protein n=1 Tax=Rhodovarius crocodyli TaxID=1979269 RepID=A0A437M3X1_9PROT|nr:hypothetical protein [Rhodovarius crocodyli]RVT92296.1 hypothetical protein EOD42_18975 [Rhodovarius crocodyli]
MRPMMTRTSHLAAPLGLALALALSACAPADRVISGTFDSVATFGGRVGAPWGGSRPANIAPESLTAARVRQGGGAGGSEQLTEEPGNVWPAAEGPRATLANPDEALRGVPAYRPESGVGPVQVPTGRRGSGAALETLPGQPAPAPQAALGTTPEPRRPRASSVIDTPSGPVVTAPSSGRVTTGTGPAGGPSSTVFSDGNVRVIQRPGQPAEQVLTRP